MAGMSITAAVAFRSLLERMQRKPASSPAAAAKQRAPARAPAGGARAVPLTSQESSFVTGNMVLSTM